MNQLIRMVMRIITRRGINMGIDYAARRGKSRNAMTREEKETAKSTKQTANKARKAGRLLRKFTRF